MSEDILQSLIKHQEQTESLSKQTLGLAECVYQLRQEINALHTAVITLLIGITGIPEDQRNGCIARLQTAIMGGPKTDEK